jgi:hypothetical protein
MRLKQLKYLTENKIVNEKLEFVKKWFIKISKNADCAIQEV